MTEHSLRQSQRRGISLETIRLVLHHGIRTRMLGAEGFRITLTRKRVHELMVKRISAAPQLLEKSQGVTLILQYTAAGWFIKTVYHKLKRHREQRSYNVFREFQKQYR